MLVQPFLPPHGEGPGAITPDGCAVDVYLALPYGGELERLAAYLPPHASVLELGCGCGRVTRRLVEAGFAVTAVDNSAAMLRHVPDAASKVDCHIERLDLGRTMPRLTAGFYSSATIRYGCAALRRALYLRWEPSRCSSNDEAWSALRQAGFSNLEWIDKRWGAARA